MLPSNMKVWAVQSDNGYSLALINDTLQRERVEVAMPTTTAMTLWLLLS